MTNKPMDELRKLIEARPDTNRLGTIETITFYGKADSFCRNHAPVLLARLERYEAALREIAAGYHCPDQMARAALADVQEGV